MIKNGKDTPLNIKTGTFPDVGNAMQNWFQPMIFGIVSKETVGFQVIEQMQEISFKGVWQPLSARRLQLKPEGQRSWSWYWLHADPVLNLEVDSVIIYNSVQYRVMAKKNYSLNGYIEYELIEDFEGAGPSAEEEQ